MKIGGYILLEWNSWYFIPGSFMTVSVIAWLPYPPPWCRKGGLRGLEPPPIFRKGGRAPPNICIYMYLLHVHHLE